MQKQEDGCHHTISFMSKLMNPAEQNYGIQDKEALTILKSLQHWQHWLECTHIPVHVLTDHKNLKYFMKPHILNHQQMQWLKLLTHNNYKISYWPGNKNLAADALSWHTELKPKDGEDEKPTVLIPPEKFTEVAACKAELTDADWDGLMGVFVSALAVTDVEIMEEAWKLLETWEDQPDDLDWEDRLGQRDG
jgi:RNase H-like domain found in reverse transcriptase